MKFKIVLIFLTIIALGVLAYFGYPIVKSRYFENENRKEQINNNQVFNSDNDFNSKNNNMEESLTENEESSTTTENEARNEIDESGEAVNITAEDCDNECNTFKDSEKNFRYCRDICGLSPIKESENCEKMEGENRDYCFKNQAVAKKDLKICDLISEAKIKASCKNRVTEEILELEGL